MKFTLLFCGLLVVAVPAAISAKPPHDGKSDALTNTVILVIRHAEKPADGNGLAPAGKARAKAYVDYFRSFTVDGQPLKLDYLFAAADSKTSQSRAPYHRTDQQNARPFHRQPVRGRTISETGG